MEVLKTRIGLLAGQRRQSILTVLPPAVKMQPLTGLWRRLLLSRSHRKKAPARCNGFHPNLSSATCIAAIPWSISCSTASATDSGNRSATQTTRVQPSVSATTSAEAL